MIIVRYILDEDAEDTEDADEDRSSFHSRTTMFVETMKLHYSKTKRRKQFKGKQRGNCMACSTDLVTASAVI